MVVVLTTSTSTLFVLTLSLSLLFDILFHGHTNTFNGRHTYTYHCSHFASLLLLLVLRFLLSEWQRPPARAAWRMRRLHQERAHSLHTHTLSRTHARTQTHTRCAAFRAVLLLCCCVDCRLFLPVVSRCRKRLCSRAIAVFSFSVAVRNICEHTKTSEN